VSEKRLIEQISKDDGPVPTQCAAVRLAIYTALHNATPTIIGTPLTPALRNVHADFGLCTPFRFPVRSLHMKQRDVWRDQKVDDTYCGKPLTKSTRRFCAFSRSN